ncbi:hypothetical protein AAY473_004015 [Plecturocebus cupreus]
MRHHAQLIFVFSVETGFHFVDQDVLDLLTLASGTGVITLPSDRSLQCSECPVHREEGPERADLGEGSKQCLEAELEGPRAWKIEVRAVDVSQANGHGLVMEIRKWSARSRHVATAQKVTQLPSPGDRGPC